VAPPRERNMCGTPTLGMRFVIARKMQIVLQGVFARRERTAGLHVRGEAFVWLGL